MGDQVQIEITAQQLADGSAAGQFAFHHHSQNGGFIAELHGVVTCLSIIGDQATATALITEGQLRENPSFNPAGQIAAVSAVNGHPDTLGFDLSFFPTPHAIAACQPAPFLLTVVAGSLTVQSQG